MANIIICDDEMPIRDWMKIILSRLVPENVHILAAENGRKAWELFRNEGAQIIFTDLKMPVMDGFELTRMVRSISEDTCIVILTSYNDFEYARTAFASKANDYILKTEINQERLSALLTKYLKPGDGSSKTRLTGVSDYLDSLQRFLGDPETAENPHSFSIPDGPYFCITMQSGSSEIPSVASHPGIRLFFDFFTEEHLYLGCFGPDQENTDPFTLKMNLNSFRRRLGEINYGCSINAGRISEDPSEMPGIFRELLQDILTPEAEGSSPSAQENRDKESEASAAKPVQNETDPMMPAGDVSPITRDALLYIADHYPTISGLGELAGFCKVTPEHFSRLFKKDTGIPFNVYLNKYRLREARNLLESTTLPFAEICRRCGFSSQSYFSKKFKEEYGQQPSNYRAGNHS